MNKVFIDEYCDLLNRCHGQKPDLLWFSTWMASKSPYFDYAHRFENAWLHKSASKKTSFFHKFLLVGKLTKTLISLLVKSTYLKLQFRGELRGVSREKPLTVLRTFYYSEYSSLRDPFWGALIPVLKEKSDLLVIYDPGFSIWKCKSTYKKDLQNFPYLVFLQPLRLIQNYFFLLSSFFVATPFKVKEGFKSGEIDFSFQLFDCYKNQLITPATLVSLTNYDAFSTVMKRYQIQKFYIPFENNPWEKMCILARKNLKKSFPIIGFQHAVIPKDAANHFLSEYEIQNRLHPDVIYCCGEAPLEILKSLPNYKNISLKLGCALRNQEPQNQDMKVKSSSVKNILIALDGTDETHGLIDLISEFMIMNPNSQLNFRFREHPNFRVESNAPEGLKFINSNKNTSLSQGALQKDLDWSDAMIYSGTTVSLDALLLGQPVIQFNTSLFCYDPLFQLYDFKYQVKNAEELLKVFGEIDGLSLNDRSQKCEIARNYAKSYFSPCTPNSIERFL